MILFTPADFKIELENSVYKIFRRKYKKTFGIFGKFIPTPHFQTTDFTYESYDDAKRQINFLLKPFYLSNSVGMPIQDMIDRWSICKIKSENGIGNASELYEFELALSDYSDPIIDVAKEKLYDINNRIWKLEEGIRNGKDQNFPLETIGERALGVRDALTERYAVINKLIDMYGQGYKIKKKNHASIT